MNESIYQITLKLKEQIKSNKIYLDLIESEKEMENNDEVIKLAIIKDQANDKYNDFVKYYKDDSNEVKQARKELYLAKEKFESHPLVKKYLENYQRLRLMLNEINDIIFDGLKEKLCPSQK